MGFSAVALGWEGVKVYRASGIYGFGVKGLGFRAFLKRVLGLRPTGLRSSGAGCPKHGVMERKFRFHASKLFWCCGFRGFANPDKTWPLGPCSWKSIGTEARDVQLLRLGEDKRSIPRSSNKNRRCHEEMASLQLV